MKVEEGISNPLSNIEPLVSIIIPTYNCANIIEETLRSVISQTYKNWECIIVDDGSSDGTDKVILDFINTESRFKYYSRPLNIKKGANSCRNIGYLKSKGDLIQWLDSDDLLSNDKLKNQVALINNYDNNTIVFCRWVRFKNGINNILNFLPLSCQRSYDFSLDFLENLGANNTFMCLHSYLIHRDILNKSGLWNEYLKTNQDAELFSRILVNTSKVIYDPKSVAYYRITSLDSLSSYNTPEKIFQKIKTFQIIEQLIYLQYNVSNSIYIENAKQQVYINIKKTKYKYIIKNHKVFFKEQLVADKAHRYKNSLIGRLERKLMQFIK